MAEKLTMLGVDAAFTDGEEIRCRLVESYRLEGVRREDQPLVDLQFGAYADRVGISIRVRRVDAEYLRDQLCELLGAPEKAGVAV